MSIAVKPLRSLIFALGFLALGCHAQTPATSGNLSPDLARRVEILIRSKSNVPPDYQVKIGARTKSEVPGYDAISVVFTADTKASKPITFLLSQDGKTLAQFNQYDISKDPKELVSTMERPARGGPANAPVVIVEFDDLECPFCAKMHQQIFPAITDRYKNQVHIVYRDFPLDQHPWAMRAAIDTSCVGAQSSKGYWNLVDYIHGHAADMGGAEKSIAKANETLDTLSFDEGKRQNVKAAELKACIAKQDDTVVKATIKEAEALGVDSTPALFINGEKIEGAVPLEYVYRMIDGALVAAGQTPPPAPPTATPAPAAKPGN
ncbi:DsbA family protein [Granulicella arctica]|uniref:DsbA family protein n=1 Tax=Granulicella arctica TaxID=940613 RepID=UPI0021DF96C1|nr:DsbA family protein [Granulicella arctica]